MKDNRYAIPVAWRRYVDLAPRTWPGMPGDDYNVPRFTMQQLIIGNDRMKSMKREVQNTDFKFNIGKLIVDGY